METGVGGKGLKGCGLTGGLEGGLEGDRGYVVQQSMKAQEHLHPT